MNSARMNQEDFGLTLGRFARALTLESLPAPALVAAKVNVFDTLACAVAGSSAPAVGEIHSLVAGWGGAPQATILAYGDKVPAHHAAWVNGTMAHARDYDDAHDTALLHAGVSVVPAALAAAELVGGVRGADFLSAVAAGLEVICRLGVATRISILESGFLYTSLFGYFGATVAAARVLQLDAVQTANALGLAYSQVAGNHQVTRDAALAKRMQPGLAAMSALMAVQLTRKGISGTIGTFDGTDGFLRVYLRDRVDDEVLRGGLGRQFEFTGLGYKAYPCCRFTHTAISAALALRDSLGMSIDSVERVRVGMNRKGVEIVGSPLAMRRAPSNTVQAQFSVPYTVAAALVDGGVTLAHFTDTAIVRQDLLALAGKIEPYVDETIERDFGSVMSPALVDVDLKNGATHRIRIDIPPGHPSRPMSPAEFDAKAQDCFRRAANPLHDGAARLRQQVDSLETLDDVRILARILEPT